MLRSYDAYCLWLVFKYFPNDRHLDLLNFYIVTNNDAMDIHIYD